MKQYCLNLSANIFFCNFTTHNRCSLCTIWYKTSPNKSDILWIISAPTIIFLCSRSKLNTNWKFITLHNTTHHYLLFHWTTNIVEYSNTVNWTEKKLQAQWSTDAPLFLPSHSSSNRYTWVYSCMCPPSTRPQGDTGQCYLYTLLYYTLLYHTIIYYTMFNWWSSATQFFVCFVLFCMFFVCILYVRSNWSLHSNMSYYTVVNCTRL